MFCFTVDDNIRFLKELTEHPQNSLFDHPYLAMMKRLHERFSLSVQLNLFYRMGDFTLRDVTARYAAEWASCADWLKLSFHSDLENVAPYEYADYAEVAHDCRLVHDEICRFASPANLADTTTVHFCRTTAAGVEALRDNGVRGLLGLFGTDREPRTSYSLPETIAARIRGGEHVKVGEMIFAPIDVIINCVDLADLPSALAPFLTRNAVHVMIHEQYFYPDYPHHQADFEEKLTTVFDTLSRAGYVSRFFEEML